MAAKPRATVRLTPSILHALAYCAERTEQAPAELARELIAAGVEKILTERTWRRDWEHSYRAWLAQQGAVPDRHESPAQADYDALADGHGFPAHPDVAAQLAKLGPRSRPLGDTIAADTATIARVSAARAGRDPRS